MNECIDRTITPKMYQDADMNPIPGYADFTEVTSSQILSADACCTQACSADQFNFLLPACPDRQVTRDAAITYGFDATKQYCESSQTDTVTYFLSTGMQPFGGCEFETTYTMSTEHMDVGITDMHCCGAAVADNKITNDDRSNWCNVMTMPTTTAELEFDDNLGQCTMVTGEITTVWKNAAFEEEAREDSAAVNMQLVDDHLCCLAYDDAGDMDDFVNIELQFACLELEDRNSTAAYDFNAKQCVVTTVVGMYVDYDANSMYNFLIDGELFDV